MLACARGAPNGPAWFRSRLRQTPDCPVARYVLACQCLERGAAAEGVRHMMVAHHAEPSLESAALLVFSGLNWAPRSGSPLLPVLLATWEEFRRPGFDRRRRERMLLDAFGAPDREVSRASPLARRLWRLPIRTVRDQIREALRTQDAVSYPLLLAPM